MSSQLDDITQTVTDHVVADAVTVRTRPSRPSDLDPEIPEGHCTNCETELKGQVCHVCGQVDDRYHRPIVSLILEALDGILSFDGRAWKTIPPLIAVPGRVTHRYLKGSRARYIQPFRLYIIASLIFFLLFGAVTNDLEFSTPDLSVEATQAEQFAELEARLADGDISQEEYDQIIRSFALLQNALSDSGDSETDPELDSPASSEEVPSSNSEEITEEVVSGFIEGFTGEAEDDQSGVASTQVDTNLEEDDLGASLEELVMNIAKDPQAWGEASLAWLPRIMFVMVPIYAALLALTYLWRRGFFFYDHLVVSLHFHAALFFAMSLLLLSSSILGGGLAILIFLIYSNAYLFLLHRRVYSRSIFTSILRVIVLDFVYLIILSIGFVGVILLGAMSL